MNGRPEPTSVPSAAARWLRTLRSRLMDPAVLVVIAVVFLISAAGQAILQAYVGDDSAVITTVLSVLGSLFLAGAIVIAAGRHERAGRRR